MPRIPEIGDIATLAVPGALALGILLPGAAAAALPCMPGFVAALVFATVMATDAARFAAAVRTPWRLLAAALFLQIALPAAGWGLARAGGADPALGLAALLLLAAPVGTSAALYVTLAGGNAAIALCLSAVTFAALPLVLPVLAFAFALPIGAGSPLALAGRSALVVLAPALAAVLLRRFLPRVAARHPGAGRGGSLPWAWLAFAALLPATLARSSGIGPMLLATPLHALAVSLLIALLLAAAGGAAALVFAHAGRADARGIAVSASARNIGVIWAATAGLLPEATEQALALSALVFYAMPPALRVLARLSPAAGPGEAASPAPAASSAPAAPAAPVVPAAA